MRLGDTERPAFLAAGVAFLRPCHAALANARLLRCFTRLDHAARSCAGKTRPRSTCSASACFSRSSSPENIPGWTFEKIRWGQNTAPQTREHLLGSPAQSERRVQARRILAAREKRVVSTSPRPNMPPDFDLTRYPQEWLYDLPGGTPGTHRLEEETTRVVLLARGVFSSLASPRRPVRELQTLNRIARRLEIGHLDTISYGRS